MLSLADRIRGVEGVLNYKFTDSRTIREALCLAGAGSYSMADGNKRLALVGDNVIKMVLIIDGYESGKTKGAITNTVNTVGSNESLSSIGVARNIEPYIYKNLSQGGMAVTMKPMATTVEAIVGAVFLDSNYNLEVAKRAMVALGII